MLHIVLAFVWINKQSVSGSGFGSFFSVTNLNASDRAGFLVRIERQGTEREIGGVTTQSGFLQEGWRTVAIRILIQFCLQEMLAFWKVPARGVLRKKSKQKPFSHSKSCSILFRSNHATPVRIGGAGFTAFSNQQHNFTGVRHYQRYLRPTWRWWARWSWMIFDSMFSSWVR
jgi:hypothetical protein